MTGSLLWFTYSLIRICVVRCAAESHSRRACCRIWQASNLAYTTFKNIVIQLHTRKWRWRQGIPAAVMTKLFRETAQIVERLFINNNTLTNNKKLKITKIRKKLLKRLRSDRELVYLKALCGSYALIAIFLDRKSPYYIILAVTSRATRQETF